MRRPDSTGSKANSNFGTCNLLICWFWTQLRYLSTTKIISRNSLMHAGNSRHWFVFLETCLTSNTKNTIMKKQYNHPCPTSCAHEHCLMLHCAPKRLNDLPNIILRLFISSGLLDFKLTRHQPSTYFNANPNFLTANVSNEKRIDIRMNLMVL